MSFKAFRSVVITGLGDCCTQNHAIHTHNKINKTGLTFQEGEEVMVEGL